MSKDPAFLFYSSDFLTGTMFMTDEQVGKYVRLLCLQHQHGHLTEQHMLYICKSHDADILGKFEKDENGMYFNSRLDLEVERRTKYAESRRNNIKKRYEKTKQESTCVGTYVGAMKPHMETETETETETENINTITKKKKLSDDEFLQSLKSNQAYSHINIERELSKMDAWLLTRPKRQKTRRFVVNWLNRIDKPMGDTNVKRKSVVAEWASEQGIDVADLLKGDDNIRSVFPELQAREK